MKTVRNIKNLVLAGIVFINIFCDSTQTDLLDGDLAPALPPIAYSLVRPLNATTVEVKFQQDIDSTSFTGVQDFLISKSDGSLFNIYAAIQDSADATRFLLTTDFQSSVETYTIQTFNLAGTDSTEAPGDGISTDFIGYDPTSAPIHPSISYTSVTALSSSSVEVWFMQPIDPASFNGAVDFVIEDSTGGSLTIYSAAQSSSNSQVFLLNTASQVVGGSYVFKTFNLRGYDGTEAPATGVATGFTGFDPASVPPNPVMDHFEIVVNAGAFTNQPFSVTINAIGDDGNLFVGYNGTVDLTSAGGTGQISPLTATLVNGTVTLDLIYSALTPNLIITATDQIDSTLSGSSSVFNVATGAGGNASINLTAAAVSTTQVRLGWQKMASSTQYVIFRKTGTNAYVQIHSISPSFTYWVDDNGGPGLTPNVTYDYKVEAYDVASQLLGTAFASAATNTCTEVTPAATPTTITANTVWTKAGGPYCVTANLTVDAWLFIEPGVKVMFSPATQLVVNNGQLNAEGNASDMVLFTSASATPARGDWGGVVYNATAIPSQIDMNNNHLGGSYISFSIIEYATRGLYANTSLAIDYSVIKDNADLSGIAGTEGAGINFNVPSGGKGLLRYSTVINNEVADINGGGIAVNSPATGSGDIVIDRTFFVNNKTATATAGLNSHGAGLALLNNGTGTLNVTLTNSSFFNLQAKSGAAVYFQNISNSLLAGNSFENISTTNADGAIHYFCSIGCQNNEVRDNTFVNISGGVFHSLVENNGSFFNSNFIHHNFVDGVTDQDGGFYQAVFSAVGSPMYSSSNQFNNNEIRNVTVTGSGGVFHLDATSNKVQHYLDNIQINNNLAENISASVQGGFIYAKASEPTWTGTISRLYGTAQGNTVRNTLSASGGDFIFGYGASSAVYTEIDFTLSKNIVESAAINNQQIYLLRGFNTAGTFVWNIELNNFLVSNNIFYQSIDPLTTITFTGNYWGSDWTASPWLGIPPAFCTDASPALSASPFCAGNAVAVSPVTTAWPHCDMAPTDPTCVGTHPLCTVDSADVNCVGVRP